MIRYLAAFSIVPASAFAEVPRVMTDIAPIHSLTAQVMGELGTPDLLLPPGADPHDFALRPSDAERLSTADVVFWVGEGLTPWLSEPLETLAPNAEHVSLLELEGWEKLDIREHGEHEEDDDHGHEDEDDHAHEDHDDHGHEDEDDHAHDEDKHDDHAHDEDKHDDHGHENHAHDHGDFDPHGWLDPVVAQAWVAAIASQLSEADPENAATYAANAKATTMALGALDTALAAQLSGLENRAYVLPHDGYQYFETHYGLTAQAAIAGIDGRTPGPAQIAEIREQMTEQNVVCVFSDVAIGERWAAVITEGSDAKTVQIDGIGVGLDQGPELYEALLTRLATQFAACLAPDA